MVRDENIYSREKKNYTFYRYVNHWLQSLETPTIQARAAKYNPNIWYIKEI